MYQQFFEEFKNPIQEKLKKTFCSFIIQERIKSTISILNKMSILNVPPSEIYDIFAVRITLDVPSAYEKRSCWLAYEVVTDFYKPHPEKLRNWISYPKPSGYQALHTTVMSQPGIWVEVQIRTRRMHTVAESGNAAHWKYKKDSLCFWK